MPLTPPEAPDAPPVAVEVVLLRHDSAEGFTYRRLVTALGRGMSPDRAARSLALLNGDDDTHVVHSTSWRATRQGGITLTYLVHPDPTPDRPGTPLLEPHVIAHSPGRATRRLQAWRWTTSWHTPYGTLRFSKAPTPPSPRISPRIPNSCARCAPCPRQPPEKSSTPDSRHFERIRPRRAGRQVRLHSAQPPLQCRLPHGDLKSTQSHMMGLFPHRSSLRATSCGPVALEASAPSRPTWTFRRASGSHRKRTLMHSPRMLRRRPASRRAERTLAATGALALLTAAAVTGLTLPPARPPATAKRR